MHGLPQSGRKTGGKQRPPRRFSCGSPNPLPSKDFRLPIPPAAPPTLKRYYVISTPGFFHPSSPQTRNSSTTSGLGECAATPCQSRRVAPAGLEPTQRTGVGFVFAVTPRRTPWHCVWRVLRPIPARTAVNLLAPQRQWIALGKAGPLTTLPLVALSTRASRWGAELQTSRQTEPAKANAPCCCCCFRFPGHSLL